MKIDHRIDGAVKDAPLWARVMIVLLAHAMGPEETAKAIDKLGATAPDYNETVAGRRLVNWIGVDRAGMEREGLTPDDIAAVREALKRRGRDVSHLEDKASTDESAELSGDLTGEGSGEQVPVLNPGNPGLIEPGTIADPEAYKKALEAGTITEIDPPQVELIAGHPITELAGKPYAELIKIEGISPKRAKEIAKMKPTDSPKVDEQETE